MLGAITLEQELTVVKNKTALEAISLEQEFNVTRVPACQTSLRNRWQSKTKTSITNLFSQNKTKTTEHNTVKSDVIRSRIHCSTKQINLNFARSNLLRTRIHSANLDCGVDGSLFSFFSFQLSNEISLEKKTKARQKLLSCSPRVLKNCGGKDVSLSKL